MCIIVSGIWRCAEIHRELIWDLHCTISDTLFWSGWEIRCSEVKLNVPASKRHMCVVTNTWQLCEIWDSHSSKDDDVLLGCDLWVYTPSQKGTCQHVTVWCGELSSIFGTGCSRTTIKENHTQSEYLCSLLLEVTDRQFEQSLFYMFHLMILHFSFTLKLQWNFFIKTPYLLHVIKLLSNYHNSLTFPSCTHVNRILLFLITWLMYPYSLADSL